MWKWNKCECENKSLTKIPLHEYLTGRFDWINYSWAFELLILAARYANKTVLTMSNGTALGQKVYPAAGRVPVKGSGLSREW